MKYSEFEKENTDLENVLNILYRSGLDSTVDHWSLGVNQL